PGDPSAGLEEALALPDVDGLHAGTAKDETGQFITSGGRVLSVVALGDDLAAARARAYEAVGFISWDGAQHRTDIALRAQREEITVPEASAASATAAPSAASAASQAPAGSGAPAVPGWVHACSGKVRDLYIREGEQSLEQAAEVLMVASDRISAYDWVLPTEIPDKGKVLTGLSLWWFDQLAPYVGNHVVSVDVPQV